MATDAATAPKPAKTSNAVKFLFGGLSGMGATLFVQPLDLVKTRMQLQTGRANSLVVLASIARAEGPKALYSGLSAALLRQATYTTTRLGVYNSLEERMTRADGTPPPFLAKAAIGMTAGAVGAVVGTPSEVALIRMMSDGRLPADQRRGYKNVFDALKRVVVEEGVLTLWRGTGPTVLRAMALNAAQLASYSQAKELLVRLGGLHDGVGLHLAASLCSGFIATAVSLPVDITKTKIQTMKTVNGTPEFKGAFDVLTKTIQREGFFRLWKGFTPYFMRLGPHTVLTFLIQEQLNVAYKHWAADRRG